MIGKPNSSLAPPIQEDLHDTTVNSAAMTAHLGPYNATRYQALLDAGVCMYDIAIYPTSDLIASYKSMRPTLFTCIIGCIFFIMALTFYMFNRYIQRRNEKVVLAAAKSNAIVSNIFPSTVRDRLFQSDSAAGFATDTHVAASTGIKAFLKAGQQSREVEESNSLLYQTQPIADLFPKVCVTLCVFCVPN
jgi:hypothetical protein